MALLPLRRMRSEGHRLQCELLQADRHCQGTASHVRFLPANHALHTD
jgi:hypothetical protein